MYAYLLHFPPLRFLWAFKTITAKSWWSLNISFMRCTSRFGLPMLPIDPSQRSRESEAATSARCFLSQRSPSCVFISGSLSLPSMRLSKWEYETEEAETFVWAVSSGKKDSGHPTPCSAPRPWKNHIRHHPPGPWSLETEVLVFEQCDAKYRIRFKINFAESLRSRAALQRALHWNKSESLWSFQDHRVRRIRRRYL